jgi:hypothetical protein
MQLSSQALIYQWGNFISYYFRVLIFRLAKLIENISFLLKMLNSLNEVNFRMPFLLYFFTQKVKLFPFSSLFLKSEE